MNTQAKFREGRACLILSVIIPMKSNGRNIQRLLIGTLSLSLTSCINPSWSTGCTTVTRLWREYSHRLRRRRPNLIAAIQKRIVMEDTANSINRGYGIAKHCVSGKKMAEGRFSRPLENTIADLTDKILQFIIIPWSCHKTLFSLWPSEDKFNPISTSVM